MHRGYTDNTGQYTYKHKKEKVAFICPQGTDRTARDKYLNKSLKWQPTPVLLPGKSHGWRILVGYSPWGLRESDTAERFHFSITGREMGNAREFPLRWATRGMALLLLK